MNNIQPVITPQDSLPNQHLDPPVQPTFLSPDLAVWLFGALLFGRIVLGPQLDALIALSGVVVLWGTAVRPNRVAWFFAGLAILALVQLILPRWFATILLEPPAWAAPWLMPRAARLSQAPWEGGYWVLLFAGMALWAPVFCGGRRFRRSLGLMLRTLGVLLTAWLIWCKLTGVLISAGENHMGILLAMLLCEPASRLREGDVFVWLSLAMIAAGIVVVGSWAPLFLAIAAMVVGASDFTKQPLLRRRLLQTAWLGPLLAGTVLTGFAGGVSLGGRLAIWQDSLNLLEHVWPWGSGFGSFRWVAAAFAENLYKPAIRALHPENAYLWFVIEGGIVAVLWLVILAGAKRRIGQAARSARLALLLLALECLIETPLLWSPIIWLLPLYLNLAFTWSVRTAGRSDEPLLTTSKSTL